jgi:HD-GYP domain-containing protein (c-di-GMP phosphodiesterase class II)
MGLWAVPVFGAPLLLVQFSVKRYTTVRSTYSQTIRSLSKVTELGGYTETGHLDRVASLSVAIGTELGMSDAELEDLERAALLHDIGQLSLAAPIPGGATSMAGVGVQSVIAHADAAVIRQTRVLDAVAEMVQRQADPYRRPHEAEDTDLPLGARIIRVVNAYDDLVGESPEQSRRLHALEQLRLGMVYDYDPRVVASLDRVLRRRD